MSNIKITTPPSGTESAPICSCPENPPTTTPTTGNTTAPVCSCQPSYNPVECDYYGKPSGTVFSNPCLAKCAGFSGPYCRPYQNSISQPGNGTAPTPTGNTTVPVCNCTLNSETYAPVRCERDNIVQNFPNNCFADCAGFARPYCGLSANYNPGNGTAPTPTGNTTAPVCSCQPSYNPVECDYYGKPSGTVFSNPCLAKCAGFSGPDCRPSQNSVAQLGNGTATTPTGNTTVPV